MPYVTHLLSVNTVLRIAYFPTTTKLCVLCFKVRRGCVLWNVSKIFLVFYFYFPIYLPFVIVHNVTVKSIHVVLFMTTIELIFPYSCWVNHTGWLYWIVQHFHILVQRIPLSLMQHKCKPVSNYWRLCRSVSYRDMNMLQQCFSKLC